MAKLNSRKASGSPFGKTPNNLIKHNRSRTGFDSTYNEKIQVQMADVEENTRREMLKKFEVLKKNGYDVVTGKQSLSGVSIDRSKTNLQQ